MLSIKVFVKAEEQAFRTSAISRVSANVDASVYKKPNGMKKFDLLLILILTFIL
jgi:hypothetical protein